MHDRAGEAMLTAQRNTRYALVLAILTTLFALRVLGQAVQRWWPVPGLPPFDEFQGSNLPYWILLPVQLALLAWMSAATYAIGRGKRQPSPKAARVLAWLGAVYMTGSVLRIVIGLGATDAAPWFTAWISAGFHVVLAAFVLTVAAYHRTAQYSSPS